MSSAQRPTMEPHPHTAELLQLTLAVMDGSCRLLTDAMPASSLDRVAAQPDLVSSRSLRQTTAGLRRSLEHIRSLVRLNNGEWPLVDEPLVPAEVVRTALSTSREQKPAAVELDDTIPDSLPQCIRGDGHRLRYAFSALLEFALAGTTAGSIQVGARWRGDLKQGVAVFYVHGPSSAGAASAGPGPNALRADIAYCPDHLKASRLGLEVAQRLMSSLGGRIVIEADSRHSMTGWLELPTTIELPQSSNIIGQADRGPCVLLVEDNAVNQAVARMILEQLGCTVWTASDGVEATLLLEHGQFDIIFMDLHMPRMDGLAATRWLRNAEGDTPITPVIAVTGNDRPGTREACQLAGMNDFIAKPLSTEALRGTLQRWTPTRAVPAASA